MHILLAWPIRPWEFRRKSGFEASRAIFWFKKRKFTAKPNEGNVLRSPNLVSRGRNDSCDPFVQFISSWILHMRRKQNFSSLSLHPCSFAFLINFLCFPGLCFKGKRFSNHFHESELHEQNFVLLRLWSSRQTTSIFRKGHVSVRKERQTTYVKRNLWLYSCIQFSQARHGEGFAAQHNFFFLPTFMKFLTQNRHF